MKRAVCLLLGLSLMTLPAWAQDKKGGGKKGGELTDAVRILKKVDAACKAVKAVKYDVTYEVTSEDSASGEKADARTQGGKIEASYILVGYAFGGPEKSLVDVKAAVPDSKEVRHITGGGDGEMYFVVDHQAKKAYQDIDPQVFGSFGRTLTAGMMIEFIHPTPFSDEINGKVQELKGSRKINGVDCYEIHVVYAAEQAPEAIWYFSKKDFLPRRRIDLRTFPDGRKTKATKTIAKLVVDPKVDKDTFKLKLPKGYTKTDDFAP